MFRKVYPVCMATLTLALAITGCSRKNPAGSQPVPSSDPATSRVPQVALKTKSNEGQPSRFDSKKNGDEDPRLPVKKAAPLPAEPVKKLDAESAWDGWMPKVDPTAARDDASVVELRALCESSLVEAKRADALDALEKKQPALARLVVTLLIDKDWAARAKACKGLLDIGKDGRAAVRVVLYVAKRAMSLPDGEQDAFVRTGLETAIELAPHDTRVVDLALSILALESKPPRDLTQARAAAIDSLRALAAACPAREADIVGKLLMEINGKLLGYRAMYALESIAATCPKRRRQIVDGLMPVLEDEAFKSDAIAVLSRCGVEAVPALAQLKKLKVTDGNMAVRDAAASAQKEIERQQRIVPLLDKAGIRAAETPVVPYRVAFALVEAELDGKFAETAPAFLDKTPAPANARVWSRLLHVANADGKPLTLLRDHAARILINWGKDHVELRPRVAAVVFPLWAEPTFRPMLLEHLGDWARTDASIRALVQPAIVAATKSPAQAKDALTTLAKWATAEASIRPELLPAFLDVLKDKELFALSLQNISSWGAAETTLRDASMPALQAALSNADQQKPVTGVLVGWVAKDVKFSTAAARALAGVVNDSPADWQLDALIACGPDCVRALKDKKNTEAIKKIDERVHRTLAACRDGDVLLRLATLREIAPPTGKTIRAALDLLGSKGVFSDKSREAICSLLENISQDEAPLSRSLEKCRKQLLVNDRCRAIVAKAYERLGLSAESEVAFEVSLLLQPGGIWDQSAFEKLHALTGPSARDRGQAFNDFKAIPEKQKEECIRKMWAIAEKRERIDKAELALRLVDLTGEKAKFLSKWMNEKLQGRLVHKDYSLGHPVREELVQALARLGVAAGPETKKSLQMALEFKPIGGFELGIRKEVLAEAQLALAKLNKIEKK